MIEKAEFSKQGKNNTDIRQIRGNATEIFNQLSRQYGAKIEIGNRGQSFFQSRNIRVDLTGSKSGLPTLRVNIDDGKKLYKIRFQ